MSATGAEITECRNFSCINPGKASLNLETWWRENLPGFFFYYDEMNYALGLLVVSISSEKKVDK